MAVSEKLKSLVDQMPAADSRGMYTTDIDKEKIEAAIAEIQKGGRGNVLGLVDMLGTPGSEENVKPHYALHCLANHVLVIKDERARSEFCQALASRLGSDLPKYTQAYLCQELGWAGGKESVPTLAKLLADDELCAPAAMALAAIRDGAAEAFRNAWPQAKGPTRLHIIDGLAELAEPQSLDLLKGAIGDKDREVRLAAGAGLAKVADGSCVGVLVAADASDGWERIQTGKNCLLAAETLAAAGKKSEAKRLYQHLRKSRTDDSEKHLRKAALRGLVTLA